MRRRDASTWWCVALVLNASAVEWWPHTTRPLDRKSASVCLRMAPSSRVRTTTPSDAAVYSTTRLRTSHRRCQRNRRSVCNPITYLKEHASKGCGGDWVMHFKKSRGVCASRTDSPGSGDSYSRANTIMRFTNSGWWVAPPHIGPATLTMPPHRTHSLTGGVAAAEEAAPALEEATSVATHPHPLHAIATTGGGAVGATLPPAWTCTTTRRQNPNQHDTRGRIVRPA